MTGSFFSGESYDVTVERRMREWQEKKDIEEGRLPGEHNRINYITVMRQMGSQAEEVASILAKLMDWGIFDQKIIDFMAENFGIHKDVLQSVDERTRNWIQDSLESFFSGKGGYLDQSSYYRHLVEALLVVARHGRAIIMGRAAGQILPRQNGIAVAITAPFELRCRRIAEQHAISLEEARKLVKKDDKQQVKFVKDFLSKEAFDSMHFDIICNTELLTPPMVANLILRTYKLRTMSEDDLSPQTDSH